MDARLPRYRASGRISLRFVPALAVAGAAASGLGWAYQALTGGGYVFLLLVEYALLAITVAGVVVATGRLGRNRNRAAGVLAGLAIGGVALAAAYYFDWRTHGGDHGVGFGAFIDARVAAGWTLGRRDPGDAGTLTGAWVWIAWVIEAIGVLGPAAVFGGAFGPFCERCGRWMDVETLLRREPVSEAATDAVAKAATVDELLRVPPAGPPPPAPPRPGATYLPLAVAKGARGTPRTYALVYKAHRCRGGHDGYLTVTREGTELVERGTYAVRKATRETLCVQVTVPDERLRALRG